MYTELRREVLRCQRGGFEAPKRYERAGRDVRVMERRGGVGGEWRLAAEPLCILRVEGQYLSQDVQKNKQG